MIPVVTVEFDPTLYAVNESAGTVRFMIVKRGSSTNDTTVIFDTSDGSATGIIKPDTLGIQLLSIVGIYCVEYILQW